MDQSFLPIAELSAYQTKWTIKARVTNKAPLRTFTKGAGQGKVFAADLLDAMGGEIKASFFNDAADKLFETLEKGKCYTFSRGSIRVANKQYNNTNHRYELVFDKDALVEASADDSSIQEMKFSFSSIRTIQTRTLPCAVDICGVITSFKPCVTVNSKTGAELVKREVTIADDTATAMTVALWGDRAKQEDKVFEGCPVVAMKSVAVREWKETRAGSLLQDGALLFKQDSPEVKRVQEWWSTGGSSQELLDISKLVGGTSEGGSSRVIKPTDLAGVRKAAEGLSSEPELFSVVARLAGVQTRKQGEPQPLSYMACQEQKDAKGWPCNRRVDESGFCAACNRAGKTAPRVNIRCRFADHEDQAWLTSFHEAAIKLLDMSADEVRALEAKAAQNGEAGREELEAVIRQRYFDRPINVTLRAKMDMYNGEARSNITVIDAKPVSRGEYGRQMLKQIHEILAC